MGKTAINGALVGKVFAIDAGYTSPAVGDKVKISGDYEVAAATEAAVVIGEVFAINKGSDNVEESLTIELRSAKIDSVVAQADVVAGEFVVIYNATQVRPYVQGTDLPEEIYGIALSGATATNSLAWLESGRIYNQNRHGPD